MFLNNRYYDPALSNFVSVDPLIGKTGTPYLYANGNPTSFLDASGLCPTFGVSADGMHGGSYDDERPCGGKLASSVNKYYKDQLQQHLRNLHNYGVDGILRDQRWSENAEGGWNESDQPNIPIQDERNSGSWNEMLNAVSRYCQSSCSGISVTVTKVTMNDSQAWDYLPPAPGWLRVLSYASFLTSASVEEAGAEAAATKSAESTAAKLGLKVFFWGGVVATTYDATDLLLGTGERTWATASITVTTYDMDGNPVSTYSNIALQLKNSNLIGTKPVTGCCVTDGLHGRLDGLSEAEVVEVRSAGSGGQPCRTS